MPKKPRKPTRKQQHASFLRLARKDGTYERLLELQGGRCGICAIDENTYTADRGRRFDIDHDHSRADLAARGLLCRGCNMKLRKGLDEPWLVAAADYMRKAA